MLTSMTRCALLVLMCACIEADPPGGQFFCVSADDCPSGFTCEADDRCYERVPDCFLRGQIGCGPGEGCYYRSGNSGGPLCTVAGTLPQFTAGCETSDQCQPGMTCVTFGEESSLCLRYCVFDEDCDRGDVCGIGLNTDGDEWFNGNVARVCSRP